VQEFLNNEESNKKIRAIIGRGSRLNINIDEIREFNPALAKYILKSPIEAIKIFEDQLNSKIRNLSEDSGKMEGGLKQHNQSLDQNFPKKTLVYHVNFEGHFA
jgi:DNA replicative helicase MCM subunit Mcm2 (Cdc46/Mcm family)